VRRATKIARRSGVNPSYKSRLIGDALDMTAKEVGANMTAIQEGNFDVDVEKWGYSSSTTWKVSA